MLMIEEVVALARLGEIGRRASRLYIQLEQLGPADWARLDCLAVPTSWRAIRTVNGHESSQALRDVREILDVRLTREATDANRVGDVEPLVRSRFAKVDAALLALTTEHLDSKKKAMLLDPWTQVCGRLPAWAHPALDARDLDLIAATGVMRRLSHLSVTSIERVAANVDRREPACRDLARAIPGLLAGRFSLASGEWTFDTVTEFGAGRRLDPALVETAAFGASCSLVGLALAPQLRDDWARLARRLWHEPAALAATNA
ncbi:MAG: hypothetical protein HYX32_13140 [Actinobacteria bacterium]|nr:hypothetical protein [Actinomycetota bacterium]